MNAYRVHFYINKQVDAAQKHLFADVEAETFSQALSKALAETKQRKLNESVLWSIDITRRQS